MRPNQSMRSVPGTAALRAGLTDSFNCRIIFRGVLASSSSKSVSTPLVPMGTQTSRPVGSKKDSSVSPPAPHAFAWTPELILKSIEVAALVRGGAWGLFVYTSKSQSAQRELAEFNTAHAKEPRLDVTSELTVRDLQTNADGTHTYKASFKVVLKNISKTTFDVSYAITEYYLGVLSVAQPGPNEIVQINPPHNIF